MSFIHFNITSQNTKSKYYCEIDGSGLFFKNGNYAEIPNGLHVISVDGNATRWNIQETFYETDCVEITMVLDILGTLIGEPTYEIITLSSENITEIRNMIKAEKELQEAKSIKSQQIAKAVLIAFFMFSAATALLASGIFMRSFLISACGGIFALVGGTILHRQIKKIKNNKPLSTKK